MAAAAPAECYTAVAQPGQPADTNLYAIAAISDPGTHAGPLDEYKHCKDLPVLNPATAELTTGN